MTAPDPLLTATYGQLRDAIRAVRTYALNLDHDADQAAARGNDTDQAQADAFRAIAGDLRRLTAIPKIGPA